MPCSILGWHELQRLSGIQRFSGATFVTVFGLGTTYDLGWSALAMEGLVINHEGGYSYRVQANFPTRFATPLRRFLPGQPSTGTMLI